MGYQTFEAARKAARRHFADHPGGAATTQMSPTRWAVYCRACGGQAHILRGSDGRFEVNAVSTPKQCVA